MFFMRLILYFLHVLNQILFTDIDSLLIYARRVEIRGISINPEVRADKMLPITQLVNAAGIDFDASDGLIFWSDVNKDSIYKVHKNGSGRELVIRGEWHIFRRCFQHYVCYIL